MTSRIPLTVLAVAGPLLVAGCSQSRAVPVVSECPGAVRVTFAGDAGNSWDEPIEVDPAGTTLGVTLDARRIWFVATDGTVLNEVSLTPDQAADADVDFPPLVIRAADCERLEAVS